MKQTTDWNKQKHRRWIIECDEEKLRLMASMVEDVTRFLCGQPDMMSCLAAFDNGREVGEMMLDTIKPMMNPELSRYESYGWSGGRCPNKWQRHDIAQGYAAYKSILAALANEYGWDNVHSGTPLTCEEGGALMRVRPTIEKPEVKEMWTATNPDGEQHIYRSKPVRRTWANGGSWEPSEGGSWFCSEFSAEIIKALGLPELQWEDEPYRFQVITERKDGKY